MITVLWTPLWNNEIASSASQIWEGCPLFYVYIIALVVIMAMGLAELFQESHTGNLVGHPPMMQIKTVGTMWGCIFV